jgi:hypothetical protein
LAKRLREDEMRREEEELLEKAIRESLAEYNREHSEQTLYAEQVMMETAQSFNATTNGKRKRGKQGPNNANSK